MSIVHLRNASLLIDKTNPSFHQYSRCPSQQVPQLPMVQSWPKEPFSCREFVASFIMLHHSSLANGDLTCYPGRVVSMCTMAYGSCKRQVRLVQRARKWPRSVQELTPTTSMESAVFKEQFPIFKTDQVQFKTVHVLCPSSSMSALAADTSPNLQHCVAELLPCTTNIYLILTAIASVNVCCFILEKDWSLTRTPDGRMKQDGRRDQNFIREHRQNHLGRVSHVQVIKHKHMLPRMDA